MKKTLLLISAFILSLNIIAATYHVKNGGSDSNNGLNFSSAFLTLQKASNIVKAGDTVLVYNGNYAGFNHNGKASGTSSKPIVFKANGNDVWVRQGSNIGDGINVENADWIEIHGFKVKVPNNTGIAGGEEGIRAVNANHITIKNNFCDSCFRGILTGYTDYITIENNTCTRSYGEHGIYVSNNSDFVSLRFNSCSYNKASGMQINPDLSSGAPGYSKHILVSNNIIFENKGAAGFNFQGIDSALIMNNFIYNNHNASGITLFHGDASVGCSNIKFYNNTIIVPSDGRCGIHIIDDANNIDIKNNIIINLHAWKGAIVLQKGSYSQTNIKSDYNVVSNKFCEIDDACSKPLSTWQGLGYDLNSILAPTNLTSLFVNPTINDYHIIKGSVAVDAGTSAVSADVTNDLDLINRPFNKSYDIGCYEYSVVNNILAPKANYEFYIYPNPTTSEITIQTDFKLNNGILEMTNYFGQKFIEIRDINEQSIKINCSNIPDGPYIISLQERGKTIATKIIIIKN
jgi:parallel beta-helix repeat protein